MSINCGSNMYFFSKDICAKMEKLGCKTSNVAMYSKSLVSGEELIRHTDIKLSSTDVPVFTIADFLNVTKQADTNVHLVFKKPIISDVFVDTIKHTHDTLNSVYEVKCELLRLNAVELEKKFINALKDVTP